MRLPILTSFVTAGLSCLAIPAHAAMPCGQANTETTRTIFEQGEFAKGANPTHTRYKAARPTIIEHPDHTCTAPLPHLRLVY